MTKTKKLMGMKDVKRLVNHWFDKRVEIENGGVMERDAGFHSFREWLETQKDRGDGVWLYQWDRAMYQKGLRFVIDDNIGVITHGIKLKNN